MKYEYHVRSQVLMGVPRLSNQYSGIVMEGDLILKVVKPDVMLADFVNAKYAPVHKNLSQPWDVSIPDKELIFSNLTHLLSKTSKIILNDEGIYQLEVDPSVPMYQVNLLKGILSQLQYVPRVGPLGTTESRRNTLDVYDVMEQSICGHCKVLYNTVPLPRLKSYSKLDYRYPYVVPIPNLSKVDYMLVMKNKDYRQCVQLPVYKFALTKNKDWNLQDNYLKVS